MNRLPFIVKLPPAQAVKNPLQPPSRLKRLEEISTTGSFIYHHLAGEKVFHAWRGLGEKADSLKISSKK